MDPFNIDYRAYESEIIDALIDVFGIDYASIITKRIKNVYFAPYVNAYGNYSYYRFLMSCKSKMMCIRFLKFIGVDVSKYQVTSFADDLPKGLEELCEKYLGSVSAFERIFHDSPLSFKSFKEECSKSYTDDYILENKIHFINAVRSSEIEEVTIDNYEEFSKTSEYKRIESLAMFYCGIYEGLVHQMNQYLEEIQAFENYYKREMQRKREVLDEGRVTLYKVLEDSLKGQIGKKVKELDSDEERAKLLLSHSLDNKSYIEYFSESDEAILENPDVSKDEKKWILIYRLSFFESMGVKVNVFKDDYYEVIKRDDVKGLIPYSVFASEITRLRKVYCDEAEERYIKEGDSYKNLLAFFTPCEANEKAVYEIMKSTKVCINSGHDDKNEFKSILYLTLRDWQCGCMDYVLVHELIHAMECVSYDINNYSCGFESKMFDAPLSENDHHETKRKYERINELVVDMFSKEVVDLLHKRGHYILDDELRTLSDFSNFNTAAILKDMIRPFYDRYRNLIIEARITGKMFLLTHYVGKENFEELNAIIDYVDALVEKGLREKLKNNETEDPLVVDYYMQLERLNRVYGDMADTYNDVMRYDHIGFKKKGKRRK